MTLKVSSATGTQAVAHLP